MDKWSQIYKNEGKSYKYYDLFTPHENLKEVETVFKKEKVKNILDLGCGVGRNLVYLSKKGFEMFGLDLSKEGINQLKKILNKEKLKADLITADVYQKLPYKDNYFDSIISVQVLQHSNEKNIIKAIKEIERVLKPGGIIFITLCGRYSKGEIRKFLVESAKLIAPNTYVPTEGNEIGLTHFIYNKSLIRKHFRNFKISKMWKDSRDYYCFLGKLKVQK